MYYLSQITKELASAPLDQTPAVVAKHGRYSELCRTYGQPEISRPVANSFSPNSLAARLLSIHFTLDQATSSQIPETNGHRGRQSFEMTIPHSCTIYIVLGLVGKRTGLPPMLLQLIWETEEKRISPLVHEGGASERGEDEFLADEPRQMEREHSSIPEQALTPRTRTLSSWFENMTAVRVRVEWSEEEVCRRTKHKQWSRDDGGQYTP